MPVRIVVSEAEFSALKQPWQDLFRSNPNHTPYQSWEWNYTWWKHFGTAGHLRLLMVTQQSRLIGIAPFFINTSYGGAPLRHLAFLSRKRADYLDFIVAASTETAFFNELIGFFREHPGEYRRLELRDFPETSTNLPYLLYEGLRAFPFINLQLSENCATAHLPPTWDGYLASLGKNARRNVIRYRRQLAENFTVRWKVSATPQDMLHCFSVVSQC